MSVLEDALLGASCWLALSFVAGTALALWSRLEHREKASKRLHVILGGSQGVVPQGVAHPLPRRIGGRSRPMLDTARGQVTAE